MPSHKESARGPSPRSKEYISDSSGNETDSPEPTLPDIGNRPNQHPDKQNTIIGAAKVGANSKKSSASNGIPQKVTENYTTEQRAIGSFDDMAGKSLWHIAIPASLPISAFSEIDMSAVDQPTGVFKHQDRAYGIMKVIQTSDDSEVLLQSNDSESGHFQAKPLLSQVYQIYELPSQSHAQSSTDSSQLQGGLPNSYAKPVRKQPGGLRRRYRPFGVEAGSLGNKGCSDESTEEKHETSESGRQAASLVTTPKKKRKKHREQQVAEPPQDVMDVSRSQKHTLWTSSDHDDLQTAADMTPLPRGVDNEASNPREEAGQKERKKHKKRDKSRP